MATRTKTFDCVEMKRRAQEKVRAEWERRKGEFSSYGEFLEASLKESEWGRRIWSKFCSRDDAGG
ncbi:MAG: hypothetical protein WBF17_27950 [Phycisphaerae bacterium]